MNKRTFLQRLSLAPLALVGLSPEPKVNDDPYEFKWRGWTIQWTGWKPSSNNLAFVSQWVAFQPEIMTMTSYMPFQESKNFYVSYPGGEGRFLNGWVFDLAIQEGQEIVTDTRNKDAIRDSELQRLFRLMQRHGIDIS